jgi:hypothetical protein
LDRKFSKFLAEVTLNDGPDRSEAPIVFRVFGDGKELWQSGPVVTQADGKKCEVSVAGVNELKIAVTCGFPPKGAHAVWVDPRVVR